ncbi:MAG: TonB-dependent receptor [Flavobacteriales bacterium]|nr:TonB-dependent receptor [Flavobacteriales bacterium]
MGAFNLNFLLCTSLLVASTFGELSASIQDSLDVKGQVIPLVLLAEAPVSVGTSFGSILKTDAPKATTVLDLSELKTAVSLTEALEFAPGVDIRSRGPWGIQSDISIRGGSFEQTALLVNGVRWSAPHTGHHLMNVPIDPEDLGHVEIVRSGSGAMAGAGAFAGSVHLQTPTGDVSNGGTAAVEIGSFGWKRFRLHADMKASNSIQRFSLSRAETDGHVNNSDAQITRAMWVSDWKKGAEQWKLMLALEDKAFGAQNFYTSTYPDQYETTQAAIAQLNWEKTGLNWRASVAAHGRYHRDRFELYREGTGWYQSTEDGFYVRNPLGSMAEADTAGLYAPGTSWYTGANQHRSLTAAVNGKFQWFLDQSAWTFSADVREEIIHSNRLGSAVEGAPEMYPRADQRTNVDALVSWRGHSESGRLVASVTSGVNVNSRFGMNYLPSADIRYRLGVDQGVVIFASAGRSVRHPSFTDLYYNVGGAQGSEDLLSEWADQAEAGGRWAPQQGRFVLEATGFIRRGRNLIDWIKYDQSVPAVDVYQAANLSSVDFYGGDVAATYRWDASLLRSARISYAWVEADRIAQDFTSSYVLDFLNTKLDLVTDWSLPLDVNAGVRYSMQQRNQPFERVSGNATFHLLSLSLERAWGEQNQIRTAIRMNNALDEQYLDIGQVVQPGRHYRFSLIFDLKSED